METPLRMLSEAGPNDDKYVDVVCTWYKDVVRLATIGDGSCFIHSVLKATNKEYQNNKNRSYRLKEAESVRYALADKLADIYNDKHRYWSAVSNGSFVGLLLQEIKSQLEEVEVHNVHRNPLLNILRVDYSLNGLQYLFNSRVELGDEVYSYVAEMLGVDIYILRGTTRDLNFHAAATKDILNKSIVIMGNKVHYETIGIKEGDRGIRTLFDPEDPFIVAMRKHFNIQLPKPWKDPGQTFVDNVYETFTDEKGNFNLPTREQLLDIFDKDDPIIKLFEMYSEYFS